MEKEHPLLVSRRGFITQTGLISLSLHPLIRSLTADSSNNESNSIIYYLIRPADLLYLKFEFINCSHCFGSLYAHKGATVNIRLPQQHIAEQNFNPSALTGADMTALSDVSDFSYLVYNLKKGHIHFDAEKWLNWDSEDKHGIYGDLITTDKPDPGAPDATPQFTRLEFPFGLWLSPVKYNPADDSLNRVFSWDNNLRLRMASDDHRNELWTATLKYALPGKDKDDDSSIDPAFWITKSINKVAGGPGNSFDANVLPQKQDRDNLFMQANSPAPAGETLDQRVKTNKYFFEVSSLGATTKLLYQPGYKPIDSQIKEWKQETSLGRDTYVEVVTSGWIFPYMLRCDFVEITRRVTIIPASTADPNPLTLLIRVAKFRRSQKEVVYDDVIDSAKNASKDAARRGSPFSSVRLLTSESPEFDFGTNFIHLVTNNAAGQMFEQQGIGLGNPYPIWTVTDYDRQAYYSFEFEATDQNEESVTFSSPFIFIPDSPKLGADCNSNNTVPFDIDVVNAHYVALYEQITFCPPPTDPDKADTTKNAKALFGKRNQALTNLQQINYIRQEDPGAVTQPKDLEDQRSNLGSIPTQHLIFNSWAKPKGDGSAFDKNTPVDTSVTSQIPFFPLLYKANVIYQPLKDFISQGLPGSAPVDVCYPGLYLINGIYKDTKLPGVLNQTKIFLKLFSQSLPIFNGNDLLELANITGATLGDTVKGIVSGAIGTITAINGNILTLSNVNKAFTVLDTAVAYGSGTNGAGVVSFTNDLKKVGSLIRPAMKAAAFSLINGIVSTAADAITEDLVSTINDPALQSEFQKAVSSFISLDGTLPKFSPAQFLPDIHLLGRDITLASLIKDMLPIGDFLSDVADAADKFIPIIESIKDTKTVTAQFQWTITNDKLTDHSILQWLHNSNSDITSSLNISCTEVIPIASPTDVKTTASCVLNNFALNFWDFVKLDFDEFSYKNDSSTGSQVNVKISDVEFGGSVSFINILAGFLETLDDALNVAIEDAEIDISYSLPIPSISLPCFDIVNVHINTGISIPLDIRSTSLSFGFNSIRDPFTIAVALFGGGGSVSLGFDTSGITGFTASFEFGGYFGLDIIVAEGDVYLFAGIYYSMSNNDCVVLGAYIRCGGEVSVLDLITVSVTFYLDLQYQDDNNQTLLTGTCTITVTISIAFFSMDVPLTFRKDLAGSAAGSHGNILAGCGTDAPILAEAESQPGGPMAGNELDDPFQRSSIPAPALGGKPFKNARVSFEENMPRSAWEEYNKAFAY